MCRSGMQDEEILKIYNERSIIKKFKEVIRDIENLKHKISLIQQQIIESDSKINATKQNFEVTLHAINSEIDRDIDAINLYL